jgi:hypothetical protein
MLRAVEVELTVEDTQGETSRVKARGEDYDAALAVIPEGSRAIAIRTHA